MRIHVSVFVLFWTAQTVFAAISASNLKTHVDSFALEYPYNPIMPLYWTGMKTHRHICFDANAGSTTGYVAYLDASGTGVHVQQVDLKTFSAVGKTFTVSGGKEAGGLVAMPEGFALMTNEALPKGTKDAPPVGADGTSTPIPVLYRVINNQVKWKTYLAGPGLHPDPGLGAAVDMNGDLVYSSVSKTFAAYFVISYYSGNAKGHFSDSIEYVDEDGKLQNIPGATSGNACSHNTGIGFEAADKPPFASVCAEDQTGGLWLNTKAQGMSSPDILIAKEPYTNGMSGEPLNGMSGSKNVLVRLGKSQSYALTWLTRNSELKAGPKDTGTPPGPKTGTENDPGTTPGNTPGDKPGTKPITRTGTDTGTDTNPNTETDTNPNTGTPNTVTPGSRFLRLFRRQTPKKKTPTTKGGTNTPSTQGGTSNQQPEDTPTSSDNGKGGGGGGKGGGVRGRQVAIALLPDKYSVGTKTIITSPPADHFNVRIAAFDEKTLLSTVEVIDNPKCVEAAGCLGTWAGTSFTQVDATTAKVVGQPFKSTEVFVGGSLVNLPNGICFPYVNMKWDTSTKFDGSGGTGDQGVMMGQGPSTQNTQKLSFACVSNPSGTTSTSSTTGGDGGGGGTRTTTTSEDGGTGQGNSKTPSVGGKTPSTATQEQQTDNKTPKGNGLHKRRMRRFLDRFSTPSTPW